MTKSQGTSKAVDTETGFAIKSQKPKSKEMDWEKELAFLVPADVYSRNQFGGKTRRSKLSDEEIEDLYAFVRRVIAQERERIRNKVLREIVPSKYESFDRKDIGAVMLTDVLHIITNNHE